MSDERTPSTTPGLESTSTDSAPVPDDRPASRSNHKEEESKPSTSARVGLTTPWSQKRKLILNACDSSDEEVEDPDFDADADKVEGHAEKKPKIDTSSLALKTDEDLYKSNLKVFSESYEGSRVFRIALGAKSEAYGRLMDTYIETADVVNAISDVCSVPMRGKIRMSQIASLAPDSVENAAQSALYFLSFVRVSFPKMATANTKEIVEFLKENQKREEEDFFSILTDFYDFYGGLPCSRQSLYKSKACRKEDAEGRAVHKETSTLRTVFRGLLAFLTMVAVIANSSPRTPDPVCRKIWLLINAKQKNFNRKSAGAVNNEKWPLTLIDLVELMRMTDGVRTQADCQAWLYALVLSGMGLRPGSVKTRRVRAADAFKEELKDEKKEEEEPVEDQNNNGGPDDDEDEKTLEIDFTGLRAKDVRVFIRAKEEGDRDVRLRVEVKVRKDKVTGTKRFAFNTVGLHHPTSLAEDKQDWSPGAALAMTLLCIAAGTIDPDVVTIDMAPEEGEMEITRIGEKGERPIFRRAEIGRRGQLLDDPLVHEQPIFERLLHSLGIPHSTYSTKSLRCGYAERILTDHVLRRPPGELVSRENIRSALYTAGRWRSAQADTYIKQSLGNLDRYGSSDGGATGTDWLRTRYRSMASTRTASPIYRVHNVDDARKHMERKAPGVPMSCSELVETARLLTYKSFHKAQPKDKKDQEIRAFFINRPVVDVRKAIDEFCSLMNLDLDNFPFYKIARTTFDQLAPPFYCLVEDCNQRFSTAKKLNKHWNAAHDLHRRSLRYVCPCGRSNAAWKGFLRHLREKHDFLNTGDEEYSFNWRMRTSAEDEEEYEKKEKKYVECVQKDSSDEDSDDEPLEGLDSDDDYVSAADSDESPDDTVNGSHILDENFNDEEPVEQQPTTSTSSTHSRRLHVPDIFENPARPHIPDLVDSDDEFVY